MLCNHQHTANSSLAFWNFLEVLPCIFNPRLLESKNAESMDMKGHLYCTCNRFQPSMLKNIFPWTSLVVQWLRICLPMERTSVPFLVSEDPTSLGHLILYATTTEAPGPYSLRSTTREVTPQRSPHTATRQQLSHPQLQPKRVCTQQQRRSSAIKKYTIFKCL